MLLGPTVNYIGKSYHEVDLTTVSSVREVHVSSDLYVQGLINMFVIHKTIIYYINSKLNISATVLTAQRLRRFKPLSRLIFLIAN